MSQLDQAKREAKRLYKLAQSYKNISPHSLPEETAYLPIKNQTEAKEHIAKVNGYPNWHSYEENLNKKDFYQNQKSKTTERKENKEAVENIEYYLQDEPFIIYTKEAKITPQIIKENQHVPIILGHDRHKKLFAKEEDRPAWLLNAYPVLITGSTGSGKTELLISLTQQYIHNNEGCIYIDTDCDSSVYAKIFSTAEQSNRINDLYVLNFTKTTKEAQLKNIKITNTIDPINPIIGNELAFTILFGNTIGLVIHEIAKVAALRSQLLEIQHIEKMLYLPLLIQWVSDNSWDNATVVIEQYLNSIGIDNVYNEVELTQQIVENHALTCFEARQTIELLKNYSGVFSTQPEIDMDEIFTGRKILPILLPALEKMQDHVGMLGKLMLFAIENSIKKINLLDSDSYIKKLHWQNIIINGANYIIDNESNHYENHLFSENNGIINNTTVNWIFAYRSIYGYTNWSGSNLSTRNSSLLEATRTAQTIVIMKTECSPKDIINPLKLRIIENIDKLPNIFYKNDKKLNEQIEGEAYVFSFSYGIQSKVKYINTQSQYYLNELKTYYSYPPAPKKIWINDFESKINVSKDNGTNYNNSLKKKTALYKENKEEKILMKIE